jgi:type III pantothenate kinase
LILELDIGNTRCKWRLADGTPGGGHAGACAVDELARALADLPGRAAVRRVRAGCVRGPQVEDAVRAAVQSALGLPVEFARSRSAAAGVSNAYREPERLGVDRWLAMLAAFDETGGAVCVLDCGSAMTADLVDAAGRHRGGFIAPGLAMMRNSLLASTDRVRFEPVAADASGAGPAPGRSTAAAVAGGVELAAAGFLRGAHACFQGLCPGAAVLLTGGDAEALRPRLGFPVGIRPGLVLDGLRLALP